MKVSPKSQKQKNNLFAAKVWGIVLLKTKAKDINYICRAQVCFFSSKAKTKKQYAGPSNILVLFAFGTPEKKKKKTSRQTWSLKRLFFVSVFCFREKTIAQDLGPKRIGSWLHFWGDLIKQSHKPLLISKTGCFPCMHQMIA